MTSAMTATSEHSGQALTRAVDGEKAGMDTGPAPLGPILEELVKRAELAKDGVWNHINWSGELEMAAGGSNSSFTLTIGAIASLILYNGTRYKTFACSGGTIGASKISGGGNLANSTKYFVYTYDNVGNLDFSISTDVPNANLSAKQSDSKYRYLGWFVTDGSGNPLPFVARRGHYLFRNSYAGAMTDLLVVNTQSPTSATNYSFSSLLPSHIRQIKVYWQLSNTGPTYGTVILGTGGDSAAGHTFTTEGASVGGLADVLLDSSRQLFAQVNDAATRVSLWLAGCQE